LLYAYSLLLIAYCLLLIAYCLLLIAYCFMLIAYFAWFLSCATDSDAIVRKGLPMGGLGERAGSQQLLEE
jgi:hypothetical protein